MICGAAAFGLLIVLPASSFAQEPCTEAESQRSIACVTARAPSPVAPVRSIVPAAFVTADKDDSEVQIQGGLVLDPSSMFGEVSLSAAATAPLADGPLSSLAELRGALPGTALELSLTGVRWPASTGTEMLQWCERRKATGAIDTDQVCSSLTQDTIESRYRALVDEYKNATGWGSPYVYQISASASYDEHEFVDNTSLEEGSANTVPFTVSGTFGRFFGPTLVTFGGRFERRFDDADEVQVCTPAGVGSAEACKTAPLGEPESGFKTVITGQARRFLRQSMAASLNGSYRLDDKTWSLEAPLYFIPDGDGALIGGIVPAWSSEDEEFTIRLFVGRAFGLKL